MPGASRLSLSRSDPKRKLRVLRSPANWKEPAMIKGEKPIWRAPARLCALAAMMLAAIPVAAQSADGADVVPEIEQNDIASLPPLGQHWAFIGHWIKGGVRIIDGDNGKILGTVHSAPLSDFAIDPLGRYFYVAETIWTRGNRGRRQDLLTVYDARTLKIVSEIEIPGRLLIGNRPLNLAISTNGEVAYVYNLDPSTAIQVVDLVKRRFVRTVEVPGCGLVMAGVGQSTSSLCGDGSMAVVSYQKNMAGTIARTPVFFSAELDPIFDNSFVDRKLGQAIFLSYTGLIYQASLETNGQIGQPWSVQEAAGMPRVAPQPLIVSWLPGGRQPIAFHRDTGRAYILMHMGEYWTQKESGTELWEVDIAARKVLRRKKLSAATAAVAISQGPSPLIFLNEDSGALVVLGADDFQTKHSVSDAGNGIITVAP